MCSRIVQHHRRFPDVEAEMTEAEECGTMCTWVQLANAQLLAAAVASWTITKSKMAIQSNTEIQSNTAIQANLHEQLVIEGMVNRGVSATSYSGAYPADRSMTPRPVLNSLGLVLFQKSRGTSQPPGKLIE